MDCGDGAAITCSSKYIQDPLVTDSVSCKYECDGTKSGKDCICKSG